MKQTKMKRYSPVRVVNPVGDNHLVPLHPNQGFVVVISSWNGLRDIDYSSQYFELRNTEHTRDGTTIFYFKQKYDLSQWATIGSVYLGEVVIVADGVAASLCVMLTSSTTDVVTVVNPCGAEVKIHPHQILEVVVYDSSFHGSWQCRAVAGYEDVQYRQIGYESILSSIEIRLLMMRIKQARNFIIFPRSLDTYEGREHHFWFEYEPTSLRKIESWKTGTYFGGRLIFEPALPTEGISPSILHVQLNSRCRDRKKLWCPRRLPDSMPCDVKPTSQGQGQASKRTIPIDDYDDFQRGHEPGVSGGGFGGGYGRFFSNVHHRNNNANVTTYNSASKPVCTKVTIKERLVPITADPLYIGATSMAFSEVTTTTTTVTHFRHPHNYD